MDNVRPMAMTRTASARLAKLVEADLDSLASNGNEEGEDPRAVRLEVANAARRWAARVDDREFPPAPEVFAEGTEPPPFVEMAVTHGTEAESQVVGPFDDEPTNPGISTRLPLRRCENVAIVGGVRATCCRTRHDDQVLCVFEADRG